VIITTAFSINPSWGSRVQWYVEVLTDPVSKKPFIEARINTTKGYRLHIFKKKDDSIWARFRLPRTMRKQLTKNKLPTFWVDNFDAIELETLKKLEVGFNPTLYKQRGKQIEFIVWGSATPGLIPPVMRQMMLGENIYIKYWTLMGDEGLAEIPLNRANEAIAQFLRVQPLNKRTDTVQGDSGSSFVTLAKRFTEICEDLRFNTSDKDYTECRELYITCSESPGMTTEKLKVCLDFFPDRSVKKDEK
tara:strand:- start:2295 stop:3035 length:741 start_codon:yes stop_codon:yes gene_type:complete